jgi:hypothetical protein
MAGIKNLAIGLLLAAACFAALGLAQRNQGVMRDEAYYFKAAENAWGWIEELSLKGPLAAVSRDSIVRHWSFNNEHPALFKTLSGTSWALLAKPARGQPQQTVWLDEISAFRLPGWAFTALTVLLIFLLGARIESRMAGLVAALLYITIPRVFFHGQLAAFDSAVAAMWLAVVYAYLLALERARWGVLAGVVFGLGLATKHNVWFVPALLLIHYLMVVWPDVSLRPFRPPRIPLVFVSMALLGPLTFLAHWPWLWFDTIQHVEGYFSFHLKHAYYNMEFLGHNYGLPPLPWAYPWVMTLMTVPTITLALALAGVWAYLRYPLKSWLNSWFPRWVRAPRFEDRFRYVARRSWVRPGKGLDPKVGRLLLINALFPLLLISLPSTPIFGGTKHWLPAYPFLALLAGVALSRLLSSVVAPSRQALASVLLVLLTAAPGALGTYLTHPFGLTQYNALAGGPAGGADLGLNRQFWGYASRQILPWLNETAKPNASVYFHDTNWDSFNAYQRAGLLRRDIRYAGMERPGIDASDYAMVFYELHFNKYDYWIWDAYGNATPARVLDLDGVPILSVYKRPKGNRR